MRIVVVAAVFAGLSLVGAELAPALAQTPHTHHHSFSGAQHWARVFDDPARDEWQKPHQVIVALNLAEDAKVADLGSGTGYFSIRLAHFVPKGRVFGVDLEPDMVKYLAERAKKDGVPNVTAVQATPDDPRLPEKVDLVLMVDVYHHIADRAAYFRKLRDSLKPGGRLAIIDFRQDAPMGPPVSARITPEGAIGELKTAGYALAEQHEFLPHQYFLVFRAANP